MALLLKKLYKGYNWVLYETADARSSDFPETSPFFMVGFICLYWYSVLNLGPKLMQNRKPFNIKKLLIVYNIVQIFINVFIFVQHFYAVQRVFQSCVLIDYSTSEQGLLELTGCRHFYWLKMFDCLETVFFVLRKSFRQISFLHLYHHTGMVFGLWVATTWYGGGHTVIVGGLNTVVHAIMFLYYLLTSIDPSWKQNIAFKRGLTQIQMIQFAIIIFSFGRILISPDCLYPTFPSYLLTVQAIFMFALFADFYRKNYMTSNRKEDRQKE